MGTTPLLLGARGLLTARSDQEVMSKLLDHFSVSEENKRGHIRDKGDNSLYLKQYTWCHVDDCCCHTFIVEDYVSAFINFRYQILHIRLI